MTAQARHFDESQVEALLRRIDDLQRECRTTAERERLAIARHIEGLLDRHRIDAPRGSVAAEEQRAVRLLADVLVGVPR